MTKTVRVENADTAPYKVLVQTWDKGIDGAPDVMAHEEILHGPTAMVAPYITSTRYLIVKEAPAEAK